MDYKFPDLKGWLSSMKRCDTGYCFVVRAPVQSLQAALFFLKIYLLWLLITFLSTNLCTKNLTLPLRNLQTPESMHIIQINRLGNNLWRFDILPFHHFLHMPTFYPLFQNQGRPCTSFLLKWNRMIPVVLSTVKNYIVYFGQKNRGNSLLKVTLGVVLDSIFTIVPEDMDDK